MESITVSWACLTLVPAVELGLPAEPNPVQGLRNTPCQVPVLTAKQEDTGGIVVVCCPTCSARVLKERDLAAAGDCLAS